MAMENWGLTSKGFNGPNQAEIREELDTSSRESFGEDINLSDKSPNGIFNGILSEFFGDLWQLAQGVYSSQHPSTATGVQLDYLTPFYRTQRRQAQYAFATVKITGTPYHVEAYGKQYQTERGIFFSLSEDVTLDLNGEGYGLVYANEAGAQANVPANTITIQVEPDSDVISVTNPEPAIGGVNREDDEELRKRLLESSSNLGSGTVNAIYSQLQELPGVRAVRISVNEEDIVVDGLPPHSIAVYTLGGIGQDIAEKLMDNYTGIQFFGSESHTVVDVGGYEHVISFSRPATTNIIANLTITTDSNFGAEGMNQIKNNIISLIGGTDTSNVTHSGLNMGDDVIYSQVLAAVMKVVGVTDCTLEIAKSGDTPSTSNIIIDGNEVATIDISDISITQL